MSFFQAIEQFPADPILSIPIRFRADANDRKVNLGVGAYRDHEGRPYLLEVVKEAENQLHKNEKNKEYLPIDGQKEFVAESLKFIFGPESRPLQEDRIYGAQTVGASAALRVAGEFLHSVSNESIYLSDPTWANHHSIFSRIGFVIHPYPYYDRPSGKLPFQKMAEVLQTVPKRSVVLLQCCCHNPTGLDPTPDQWGEIATIIQKNGIIPLFDLAYQGFGEDTEKDAAPIRHFVERGIEVIVSYSYAKNMGLYGERVGLLAIVCQNKSETEKVGSHIKGIIRGLYSSPPLHGASIARIILSSPDLKRQWLTELAAMQQRIFTMRNQFADLLTESDDFHFLREQRGMFSYLGLSPRQVQKLEEEFSIYMTGNARINVAGLTEKNMDYVANAIKSIL